VNTPIYCSDNCNCTIDKCQNGQCVFSIDPSMSNTPECEGYTIPASMLAQEVAEGGSVSHAENILSRMMSNNPGLVAGIVVGVLVAVVAVIAFVVIKRKQNQNFPQIVTVDSLASGTGLGQPLL